MRHSRSASRSRSSRLSFNMSPAQSPNVKLELLQIFSLAALLVKRCQTLVSVVRNAIVAETVTRRCFAKPAQPDTRFNCFHTPTQLPKTSARRTHGSLKFFHRAHVARVRGVNYVYISDVISTSARVKIHIKRYNMVRYQPA